VTLEGNRNALLALHYREGDTTAAAAHVESCAECRAYLQAIAEVEGALGGWMEEAPPADLRERVLTHATLPAQLPARPRRAAAGIGGAPLLAALPVMAMFVIAVQHLGTYVADLSYWAVVAPSLPALAPFGVAALMLAAVGGLASLALAPVLVLENRKS